MNQKLRIFLADDHAVVREGLKRLIDAEPDMEVCGEAASAPEALQAVPTLEPNVIVLDISMPEMSGAGAAKRLLEVCPAAIVLVLTVHEDTNYVRELLQAGASAYVLKRSAPEELIGAIRTSATGSLYLDPHVSSKLVSTLIPRTGRFAHPFADLSERETDVLRLIAQGYSNREIADSLKISTKTVETYKARSMEKLGLKTRVDLVRTAVGRGWLRSNTGNE